jgi:hypothetical protein
MRRLVEMVMRTPLSALLLAPLLLLAAGPVLADPGDDPPPRFEDAVCPGVAGLQTATAEYLVGRIRQNAEALGRRMARPETCEPNLIVAFVDDGQAELQRMDRDRSYAFVEMTPTERRELLAQEGPVHVLSRVWTRTRDGLSVYRRESLSEPAQATMWMAHSKIYSASRHDIVHAMILFDRAAVRGMNVDQLADYATLRAFVHEPPTQMAIGTETILNLFDAPPGARPTGLTTFDHALLAGLYEGIPNLNGAAREAVIVQATGRQVAVE